MQQPERVKARGSSLCGVSNLPAPGTRPGNGLRKPFAQGTTMTNTKDWFASDDPPPMPALLPSVTDLGRLAAAASASSERYDRTLDPTQAAYDGRQGLLCDRDQALRTLLTCYRAASLTDAITQLYAGYMIADESANNEMPVADYIQRADSLRRIFLSALPAVAASARFDLAEIGADYILGYADHEFPAEA
jgi:hypothetical protein